MRAIAVVEGSDVADDCGIGIGDYSHDRDRSTARYLCRALNSPGMYRAQFTSTSHKDVLEVDQSKKKVNKMTC